MSEGRIDHTATLLLNGEVLVAGGNVNTDFGITTSEAPDAVAELWSPQPAGRLVLRAKALTVSRNRALVPLRCQSVRQCLGTVSASARGVERGCVQSSAQTGTGFLAPFSIAPEATKVVTFRLTRGCLSKLQRAKGHTIRINLTAHVTSGPAGVTKSVRLTTRRRGR
jgi:hypothetical protein